MLERFNKRNVATVLYRQWRELGLRHDFTNRSGRAQVEGHPVGTVAAYGEFNKLRWLLDHFDLWDCVPDEETKHKPFGLHNGLPRFIKD